MRVVKPVAITDAMLTSNIPEPDASVGEVLWTAGTYNTGDRRILTSTHTIYQVVADPSTTDAPDVGVAKTVPTWVVVGSTNKWAMFDQVNDTKSAASSPIEIEIETGQLTNSLAVFNLNGSSDVTVTMTDPVVGIVYTNNIDMIDNSDVVDYYEYFFSPIINKTEFVLLDLPAYKNATISVSIAGDAAISLGTLIVGAQITLGVALYGTSMQLLDFSRKERNEFGNYVIVPRRTSKLVDFDVIIDKAKIGYVFNQLASMTTIPAVWVGTDVNDDSTLVYGYYKDSQINIDGPVKCTATLQIEGLT
ncbi:MAG: hypothetical protein [Caudoviricetes sp.]|nr:MAG: hypothetical protein [Caudoviricetes sp.]